MMKNRKWILGLIALAVIAGLLYGAYTLFMPEGETGAKQITLTVVQADGQTQTFAIRTDQAYLRGALEEQKLIAGEESDYGLYVKTVNGTTADEGKQEWWCFTQNGETLMTGVDATPIVDGDCFEATLTAGY